ncbi:hypothetical protein [Rhodanobacter sp. MP1X3]|jgi:hypothetical protein|nr:hypothetical protein [Rhodanobacter sp. MP1X3]MBB6243429.1 hypothetical protein [Rhodanobacter sp. MP1X3]
MSSLLDISSNVIGESQSNAPAREISPLADESFDGSINDQGSGNTE